MSWRCSPSKCNLASDRFPTLICQRPVCPLYSPHAAVPPLAVRLHRQSPPAGLPQYRGGGRGSPARSGRRPGGSRGVAGAGGRDRPAATARSAVRRWAGTRAGAALVDEARALRSALRRVADAAAAGRPAPRAALERVNALLARGAAVDRVIPSGPAGFVTRRDASPSRPGRPARAHRGSRRRLHLPRRPDARPALRPSRVRAVFSRWHQERHAALVRHAYLRQPRQRGGLLPPPSRQRLARWLRPTATSPRDTSGMGRITTRSTAFPFATTQRCSSASCWRSTRPACPGSPFSRSARPSGAAYDGFDPAIVARYGARERRRLLADAGIIRNRLKIDAAIENAATILELRRSHGSFAAWLDAHHPRSKADWVKLFKRTFRFTGGEIVGEFLMSTGYLPGAHAPDCPVYAQGGRRSGRRGCARRLDWRVKRARDRVAPRPLVRQLPRSVALAVAAGRHGDRQYLGCECGEVDRPRWEIQIRASRSR